MKKKLEEKLLVFGIVLCFLSISLLAILPSLSGILALLTIICFASVKREYGIVLWVVFLITFFAFAFILPEPARIASFHAFMTTIFFVYYSSKNEDDQAFSIICSFSIAIFSFAFSLFSLHYMGGATGAIIGLISYAYLRKRSC